MHFFLTKTRFSEGNCPKNFRLRQYFKKPPLVRNPGQTRGGFLKRGCFLSWIPLMLIHSCEFSCCDPATSRLGRTGCSALRRREPCRERIVYSQSSSNQASRMKKHCQETHLEWIISVFRSRVPVFLISSVFELYQILKNNCVKNCKTKTLPREASRVSCFWYLSIYTPKHDGILYKSYVIFRCKIAAKRRNFLANYITI